MRVILLRYAKMKVLDQMRALNETLFIETFFIDIFLLKYMYRYAKVKISDENKYQMKQRLRDFLSRHEKMKALNKSMDETYFN